jgi:hypothetical protein
MAGGWMKLVALAFLCAAPLHAQEVSAVARLDSTRFLIGDPIPLKILLTHPEGAQFTPLVGDTLGSFSLLQPPSREAGSGTESTFTLVLSRYDSGTVSIPSIRFSYTLPGDTSLHTVTTEPLTVSLALVEVDTTQPIRDLKPPLDIPMTLAEIAIIAGVIIAAAALAFFLYRYWKKRKSIKPETPVVHEVRPPHILALEELGLLKSKRLWQQGLIKEYYSEVTEIVRRYFENRYHVAALEQTTEEILDAIGPHVRQSDILDLTGRMLTRADLVKFAKFTPGIAEHEEALTSAYEIVEKTKSGPASGDHDTSREVAGHAGR